MRVTEGSERRLRGHLQLGRFSGNFNKTFDAAGKLTFSIKCRQLAIFGKPDWDWDWDLDWDWNWTRQTFWPSFMIANDVRSP